MKSQDVRLHNAIRMFVREHPASRVKTNLTRLLLAYLENTGDCQPGYHKELVSDLEGLLELMDALEKPVAVGRTIVGSFN